MISNATMLRYGINDIRCFYENDVRFLKQFCGMITILALLLLLFCQVGFGQLTNVSETNKAINPDSTYLPLPQKINTPAKTNIPGQVNACSTSESKGLINDILNSNLAAALIGFASALLVFYLTEQSQSKKQTEENGRKYLVLLNSTRDELAFYGGKLTTLDEKLTSAILAVGKKPGIILPSFSLYPKFLEQSKIELNALFQNASLVQEVGHCHFEMCHVLERLNWLKSETFIQMIHEPEHHQAAIMNLQSIQGLVGTSILAFQKTASKLDDEIQRVSALFPK